MSAIYKLSIQGIRSFDANDRETIEFGKPLTLIVGANGSGKTTIIECLKYATTGDLPPNSKSGAFIHDPKITGEKDIRAQVKLAFTNARGSNMIVTRNIQLLAKKNTNTFKTLEGQLVAINKSERTTLSTRASELDQQIPLYLGVPKAILDYVIFCHQEDALWPLSEPSILKKRFDEIFQALKFTKALDNLKVIKKDMSIDIKLLRQSVDHLKMDRDRANATKHNISKLNSKIGKYNREVDDIEIKLNEITRQSDDLFHTNQQFQEILSNYDHLQLTRKSLLEQIQRMKSTVNVLPISKADLESRLQNFSEVVETKRKSLKQMESRKMQGMNEMEKLQAEQNRIFVLQGELVSKRQRYELSKTKMDTLLTELSCTYDISKENVTKEVSSMLTAANAELSALQKNQQREEEQKEQQLSTLRSTFAKKEQQLTYIDSDLKKLEEKSDRIQKRLSSIVVTKSELVDEKEALRNYELKLQNENAEASMSELTNILKSKNAEVHILEENLDAVNQRLTKVGQHSDLYAKRSLLKQAQMTKKNECESLIKIILEDQNAKCLAHSTSGTIVKVFNDTYSSLKEQLHDKKDETNSFEKQTMGLMNEIKHMQTRSKTILSQNEALNKKLTDLFPEDVTVETYDTELQDAEASYRIAVENLKMHKTTLEFNMKALEVAKDDNCCYLCQRKFQPPETSLKLIQDLQNKTNRNFQIALENTVAEVETYLNDLRNCLQDVVSLRKNQQELVGIAEKLKELDIHFEQEKLMLAQKKHELSDIDAVFNKFDDYLRPLIHKVTSYNDELERLQNDANRIEEELSIYTTDDSMSSIEELQQRQKEINDKLKNTRKAISDTQSDKDEKAQEHNNLLTLIREKNTKINTIEQAYREKISLESELTGTVETIKGLKTEYTVLSSEKEILRREIDEMNGALSSIKLKNKSMETTVRNKKEKIQSDVEGIIELEETIKQFNEVEMPRMERCEIQLNEHREIMSSKAKSLKDLEDKINEGKQILLESDNEYKNIKLNIELVNIQESLKKTEGSIAQMNISEAEEQRGKYQEESLRLRGEYEKLSAENAGRLGEIKQLQNQITSLTKQLQTDYKDIDELYQREWIKLQTKTLATDDIDTYSKALDSAIMRYHSLKMEDINRIVDELWKRTYSGTDVDTIKIKTDEVSNTRGKSYNYRVVMYKQDAELDMRGRCSAGQKVLAAIIIRLALSETFGVNCGVITLDEPTTNLDEENIESLAKSLSNIIEVRRHQKNFQLIVITHDEKFLNHMNASSYVDHFYKVKRDDRQKSQIEWVDINRVNP